MSSEERVAWVSFVAGGIGMLAFVTVVLIHSMGGSATGEQDYSIPMIMCIFAMVVPVWVSRGLISRERKAAVLGPDERDREIARRAAQVKFQVLLIACVIVLSMVFSGADHFWIASTVFAGLGFSALVGSW